MSSGETRRCDMCGRPGIVHITEIRHGLRVGRAFCIEHAQEHTSNTARTGPDRTAAEEVSLLRQGLAAFVREQMADPDQQVLDPAWRAAFNAEMERLVADIERGQRRHDEPD